LRKIATMSEENYDVSAPCTHPELKKYYKSCSVAFETWKNGNGNIKNVTVTLRLM
jgi:hypothetical protein